jgi:hypothetical protein
MVIPDTNVLFFGLAYVHLVVLVASLSFWRYGCGRAPSVYSILLLLLRDSANFKIRIHAACALAVPVSRQGRGAHFEFCKASMLAEGALL